MDLKVGDQVYCLHHTRTGVVTHINKNNNFPVRVAFKNIFDKETSSELYYIDGRICFSEPTPTLIKIEENEKIV